MIFIAAYWLLLFLIFLIWGVATDSVFKTKASHPALVAMLGIFPLTTGFTLTVFFLPLSRVNFVLWLILTLIIGIAFRNAVIANLKKTKMELRAHSWSERLFLTSVFICILYKSAQLPSLTDNDTYYVQTIKWLNEYGLVKGIANLHLFLGQQSPWHFLQAGLNFSFTSFTFNDINGFLLTLFYWYVVGNADQAENRNWFSYTQLSLPLLIFFIDSPSPDLSVILFCLIAFYLLSSEPKRENNYRLVWSFLLFTAFIKITAAPLVLVFLLYPKQLKSNFRFALLTAIPLLSLWVGKNYVATGHPFYPFTFDSLSAAWAVPDSIIRGIHRTSNAYVYGTSSYDLITKVQHWLVPDSARGCINIIIALLFTAMPFFPIIRKNYPKLYFVSLLHFIILLTISPQIRFMLPELIFFGAVIAAYLFKFAKEKWKQPLVLSTSVLLVLPVALWHSSPQPVIIPAPNTHYPDMKFKKCFMGNLKYHSPINDELTYNCGDGPLPCVNERQIKYIRSKYGYIPQIAGENIAEGFVSKKAE